MSNTDVIPIEYQSLVRYEEQWQVLICLPPCGHAIASKSLIRHLRSRHQMKRRDYRSLTQIISSLPMIEKPEEFPRPLNNSSLIEGLPIHKGYKCNHCDNMLTQSEAVMKTHIFNEHRDARMSGNSGYQPTRLQTWGHSFKGYWTILDPNNNNFLSESSSVADVPSDAINTSSWEERMIQMEKDRQQIQENGLLILHERNKKDDTTPWLLRTKWPELFSGKNIKLIGETRLLTTENRQIYELFHIRSATLGELSRAFDRIVRRAEESLASTPWNICCWLRSVQRNQPDRRPFGRTQEERSERVYINHWKQFLYYCFRTCSLDPDTRRRLYGIQFTVEQETLISEITDLLHDYDDDENEFEEKENEEGDENEKSSNEEELLSQTRATHHHLDDDRLSEKLFHLCITILTQRFQSNEGPQSPLLQFALQFSHGN